MYSANSALIAVTLVDTLAPPNALRGVRPMIEELGGLEQVRRGRVQLLLVYSTVCGEWYDGIGIATAVVASTLPEGGGGSPSASAACWAPSRERTSPSAQARTRESARN
jgi:hypothetical protein